MKARRFLFAGLVILTLGALAGCDLLAAGQGSTIFGTLNLWVTTLPGGTSYEVILYAEGTAMHPYDAADLATSFALAPRVFSAQGMFPGGPGDQHGKVTFQVDGVPPGTYTLFVWLEADAVEGFDPPNDPFGFYHGDPNAFGGSQPFANIVVPEAGLVGVDVWLDYWD